jgi:nitroimidazol reductase NimA-like FMN-containing flavoprotein (pyridoxamine 5'-phosphate oxidase superfamily)
MAKIRQAPVPAHIQPALIRSGITIKKYRSARSFEKDLRNFIKRNEVLHLCTQKKNAVRSTPVGYKSKDLIVYVLSEGGGKFANLKENKNVAFSIAEPFKVAEDFWGYKGMQVWGKAKVYSRKEHPRQFEKALEMMNLVVNGRKLRAQDLSSHFNHKIIEINPLRIKYTNPREGVFNVMWVR